MSFLWMLFILCMVIRDMLRDDNDNCHNICGPF